MAAKDLAALDAKAETLSDAEQLSFADAIDSGFDHGDLDAAAVLSAMQRLSVSRTRQVATTLLGSYSWIREHLADDTTRPKLDAWAANLYRKRVEALGYTKRDGESDDDTLLRAELVGFLGTTLRDPATRRELMKQGEALLKSASDGHLDFAAVNPELMGEVLTVLVQDRGASAIDAVKAELARQTDPMRRSSLSAAIGATFDAKLSEAARNFGLKDKSLSLNESQRLLRVNRSVRENRAAYWTWFQANYDAVVEHATQKGAGGLPEAMSSGRCSAAEEKELETYFTPRVGKLVGGQQSLARARERIGLCTALHDKQAGSVLAKWLSQHG
jgi:alanyl aminopeptidase